MNLYQKTSKGSNAAKVYREKGLDTLADFVEDKYKISEEEFQAICNWFAEKRKRMKDHYDQKKN